MGIRHFLNRNVSVQGMKLRGTMGTLSYPGPGVLSTWLWMALGQVVGRESHPRLMPSGSSVSVRPQVMRYLFHLHIVPEQCFSMPSLTSANWLTMSCWVYKVLLSRGLLKAE